MCSDIQYIEAAIALPMETTFTYAVPEILAPFAETGKRVLVPFGRRRVTGYILGPGEYTTHHKIRAILDVLDEVPLFPRSMIPFFRWISDYYLHPLGQVIRAALPGGLNLYDISTLSITQAGEDAASRENLTPLKKEILLHLKNGTSPLKALCKAINRDIPHSLIRTMEKNGWILKEKGLKRGTTRTKAERYASLIRSDIPDDRFYKARKQILDALASEGEMSVKKLKERIPKSAGFLNYLKESGYISVFDKKVYRDPFGESIKPDEPLVLTDDQEDIVSKIIGSLEKGFAAYLLAGVTGSGKTEVYMQIAAEVIRRGKSVLVLVPEIALISQTQRRFRARFGERVAILHSGLSPGERYDQWMRILKREVRIAIGARSAVFAPFPDIGLIIVDEEHDTSYKQEHDFFYNARDIAIVRAKLLGGIALLGSATPSVQSYYNVKTKKFIELRLDERVQKRPLPDITVVDLRKNRDDRGIRRFITQALYSAISETLGRGEQSLIFLNRRGFAGFPVCAACGSPLECDHCDITLTFHQSENAYKCHYCGFTRPSASRCPVCNSPSIKPLGFGTEKVEKALKSLFPQARVARMDRDTTSQKGSLLKILRSIRHRQTDILVGTQMVAKGHDFPGITLVGIICADLSLSQPDFRAAERTFQLLAQVAGRAGRGDVPGKVILQTYNPQHFSIQAARDQDFKAFYDKEILFRNALGYPPLSRLIQLKISGKDKKITREFAREAGMICHELQKSDDGFASVKILGPVEASISKIAQHYRWQMLLKGPDVARLHQFVRRMKSENPSLFNHRQVKLLADVDPFVMY
jgi:primosomal protein N' (replication factor Y)